VSKPITATILGLFALAAYLDGAIWQSGCSAGVAAMMIADWLRALLALNAEER
jgi:hypothetical protein